MHRRNFIKKAGLLGSFAVLPFSCASPMKESRYKMGYQLFSIRDEMAKDPVETLKKLKAMGYEAFEIYGIDDKQD